MSPSDFRLAAIREAHDALLAGKASKYLINLICEILEMSDALLTEVDAFYDHHLDHAADALAEGFEALGEAFE